MTMLALYGGPLKRVLIERAFGLCGQSTTQYELSAEEYKLGLQCADDLASTLGSGFGWNSPPEAGVGSIEDESGILEGDVYAFVTMLAQEIAPNIGAMFAPNGRQATAKSALEARYQVIPAMQLGRGTIRGAGNSRRGRWFGPFFGTCVADDEPAQ